MFQKSFLTMLITGAASIALPAYAQTEGPGRQEVAVQVFGSFVTSTTQNGVDNSATSSGGVLASYRYFFSTHHGVEASLQIRREIGFHETAGHLTDRRTR